MNWTNVRTNNDLCVQLPDLLHGERVGDLALELAVHADIEVDKILLLKAAIFHDIGKAALDKEVLNKPATLSEEEYEHVKKHSKYGALILKSAGINRRVKDIVMNHHERYDGSGYPEGKETSMIPIEARLIGICDDYDALISERPYRNGFDVKKALRIIHAQQAKYDPYICNKFMEMICKSVLDPLMDRMFINHVLERLEEEELLEGAS